MNKRTLLRIAAGSLIVAVGAVTLVAQSSPPPPPPGPQGGAPRGQMRRGGMGAGMMLLQMKSVQRELKLSAEQVKQIEAMRPPIGGPGQPGAPGGQGGFAPRGPGQPGPGGPGGPPPQGGAPRQPGQGGGFGPGQPGAPGEPGQMRRDPFMEILNETQQKRLQQLVIQFNAPMTLLDPRHGETLRLTDEQRQALQGILEKHGLFMGRGPGGPGAPGGQGGFAPRGPGGGQPPQGGQPGAGPQPPAGGGGQRGPVGPGAPGAPGAPGGPQGPMMDFATMQKKKAAAMTEAMKVLTSAQEEAWGKLTGPAFNQWEEPRRPQN